MIILHRRVVSEGRALDKSKGGGRLFGLDDDDERRDRGPVGRERDEGYEEGGVSASGGVGSTVGPCCRMEPDRATDSDPAGARALPLAFEDTRCTSLPLDVE